MTPDHLPWEWDLRDAIARELSRNGRHPGRIAERAPWMARDAGKAWRCYQLGAAGALFDVLDTFDLAGLAVPPEIAAERDELLAAALRGEGVTRGRGNQPPLATHAAALRRRLRAEVVGWFYGNATLNANSDAEAERLGWGEAYWKDRATWPEMPPPEMKACCERARIELGETMVEWRAVYEDARGVAKARRELGGAWPGPFYLPSLETCGRLGLGAGVLLIRKGWAASEAPWWGWE